MRIDRARARAVFAIMLAQYQARQHPFLSVQSDRPQYHVPKGLCELQLARFLFYLCFYMRGGIDSVHAARQLTLIHAEHPWLFTSEVLRRSEAEITAAIAPRIPLFRERIGRFWLHNAQVLWSRFAGDPRRIFLGVKNAHESYYRTMGVRYRRPGFDPIKLSRKTLPLLEGAAPYRGLIGFREKMTSMLAYFLFEMNLINKAPPLSAPVDFHHLRIYLQTGMIVVDGSERVRYEHLVRAGIALALYLQRYFALPMHEYGDIVWLWSKILCGQAPQNRSVEVAGDRGRLVLEPAVLTWNESDRLAFAKSCGECAIRALCHRSVPSGEYYTQGNIRLIPREDPPGTQPLLFALPTLPQKRRREDGRPDASA